MRTNNRGRIRSRIAALLLSMVAAVGLSGLIANPAYAAYGNCVGVEYGELGAGSWVCFNPVDELLKVCDTAGDGHHASAAVRGSADDHWFEIGSYGGIENPCRTKDFNMPEDSHICYTAMVVEGDEVQWWYLVNSGWISAADGSYAGQCPSFDPQEVDME
jgi:hypothetical protein